MLKRTIFTTIAIDLNPFNHPKHIRNQEGDFYCLQINEDPFGSPRG